MKKKPNITARESLLWTCSVVVELREDTVLLQLRSCAGVCESSYNPQVEQHCFWTDLREQRPNSFNLSQKREDMVFFLQTGPAGGGGGSATDPSGLQSTAGMLHSPDFPLHSSVLHFLSVSGLEIFSQRLFGITAESCTLTHLTSRCW